jgi:hypothetical protein
MERLGQIPSCSREGGGEAEGKRWVKVMLYFQWNIDSNSNNGPRLP